MSGSSRPAVKEIIESAFLLGRLQHEGKTVLIDRVHATTRKLTAKIGAPKCECRLNDLDAFQKGILRGAHSNEQQHSVYAKTTTTEQKRIKSAWDGLVADSYGDTLYKNMWTNMFFVGALPNTCLRHSSSVHGLSPSNAKDIGAVYVKIEGIHRPVTPPNITDSESDSSLSSIPHTTDSVLMTGLPDFCVCDGWQPYVDVENKKRGCNVSQLLYCMLGHALQHKQDMFGVFCDQDRYQPWLVKRRDDVLRFYEGPWLSGLQGLLDVHMLMWQYVTAQHSTTD